MARRRWLWIGLVLAGLIALGVGLFSNHDDGASAEQEVDAGSGRRRPNLGDLARLAALSAPVERGGGLFGQVKGEGEGPAVVSAESAGRRYRCETQADGTFALEHLAPGEYLLRATRGSLGSDPLGPVPIGPEEEVRDLVLTLGPGGGISGVVLNSKTRAPIPQAVLVSGSSEAQTNDSGEFTIQGLPVGEAFLAVRALGFGEAKSRVVVPRGKVEAGTEILLAPQAHVQGKVQQADGRPAAAAVVVAEHYAFGATMPSSEVASTGDDGSFDGYLDPGRVTLVATVPTGEARSNELDLRAGDERTGLVLVVDIGGQIVGSVTDVNGQPGLGAQLTAVETQSHRELASSIAGPAGRFQFDNVPTGTYAVVARLNQSSGQAVGLRIEAGDVATAQIQLGSGELAGKVVDSAGQAVLGAVVSVSGEGAGGAGAPSVETAADGAFKVTGLGGARFAIEVKHVSGHAQLHGIAAGTHDLVIRLAGESELHGYVTDDQGQPVTDFQVLADPIDVGLKPGQGGNRQEGRFASATGDFHLKVTPGRYSVRVSASGYTTVDAGQTEAPAGGSSTDLRVVLHGTRSVMALVVNAQNGQPIAGARVATNPNLLFAFGRADPVHFGGFAITDGSGQATISDAEPGNTRLFASADGYGYANPVGVPSNQDPNTPVRIALNPGDTGNRNFSGVGMQISPDFRIGSVFDDGPANLAGIRQGDQLVSVDGVPVQGQNLNSVINLIRGDTGQPVVLGLSRDGQSYFVDPTRAEVKF